MSTTSAQNVEVVLPELGESVTEGIIIEWRVAPGDVVGLGDILLDLTTDKVDVEVPATAAGTIVALHAEPGDTVEVGAVLVEINTSDDAPAAGDNGSATSEDAPAEAAAPAADPVQVVIPELGESVTEGIIIEWRVAPGDVVAAGDPLVELTTDKVDVEVPATAAGAVIAVHGEPGDTVEVGALIADIDPSGAAAGSAAPAPKEPTPSAAPASGGPAPSKAWPEVSPVARRLAQERGIDLERVSGSGPGGIIRKEDVLAAAESGGATPGGETATLLRGPAAALARYMDDSRSIPTATSFRTLSVGALDAERKGINKQLAEAGREEKLSFTHLLAWAIIKAATTWPVMGTGFEERDGQPHRIDRDSVNLGLAVDVERKDGSRSLMVPVVRDADRLGFVGFRDAFDDLVGRTRKGGVTADELRGASITLTNPGGIGTVASVPRLMNGQGTIIAAGAIGYPPGMGKVPPETLAEMGVEKVMTLTSTYDHRVIQGAESGAFLAEVDALLLGENDFYEEVRDSLGLAAVAVDLPRVPVVARSDRDPELAFPEPLAEGGLQATADGELLAGVAAAMSLVKAFRSHGHLAADLDPLGAEPVGDPALVPENLNLTSELMARIPAELLRVNAQGDTFAEVLPNLAKAYCGKIAYETEHLSSHEERLWLRSMIESGDHRSGRSNEERAAALESLIRVDSFERFLRRTYLGQKTFSIEGVDTLVPVIDEVVELAAAAGTHEVLIGMAHRGRLSVITHVVGRPLESILAEFEGHMAFEDEDEGEGALITAGDVKYHLGAGGAYRARSGKTVSVLLSANPSHLEQVNAVVEGETRAWQTDRSGRAPQHDPRHAVPVVVHGDAAFTGQGVVAETLNLSGLDGYSTGGTVHIIANNQIGFTTDPPDSRSTHHTSDLARGFDIPIIHVNADDVDECLSAARLAVAYRERFHRDVLINLIGYRRLGHNETDEPAYTQPVMTRTIKEHPPVNRVYAEKLVGEGVVDEDAVASMVERAEKQLAAAHSTITGSEPETPDDDDEGATARREPVSFRTGVSEDVLRALNEQLLTVPDGFAVHPKLTPQLDRRRVAMDEGGIAWGHAEALALASMLVEGIPVRLTGQDVARGTFSQRHLELHDVGEDEQWSPDTGRVYVPMANLRDASASFELYNSPLSEAACVGFEYGYSTVAPGALVLWEAQYGDFANGAQIMIDQFIVSGRVKWGERSRLTMLLPHGYEGSGPEHSSARMERFLQLAAEDNIRVANPTTAAQYFHLLRQQAKNDRIRPLVVFTPKSLLRLKGAGSELADLTEEARFQAVLDDPEADPAAVRRIVICSGKVFHDLTNHPKRGDHPDLAVIRVEQLYPFPSTALAETLARYEGAKLVNWLQEEPRNMGAWDYVRRAVDRATPDGVPPVDYIGRDRRASPSEGYPQAHQAEQERLLTDALTRGTNGAQ
ncbi:MAG: multifunctional oxoglutarate decarboxylase/oxoglutarate dehydrogenase thiamine pyrophosphate-binding subunit/dihydrolipoyllysine-residue succinyltransferase subunit [Miltoncostaeaceae bacterium]